VSYTHRTYSPLLGEPALRLKLRRLSGPVSVPVLTDDDGRVYADSSDIARWADARGEGPRLFPEGQDARIAEWVALSERGLSAGRGLSLRRLLTDDEGLFEMVPRKLRSLGGAARAIAAFGVRRTLAKYGAADRSNAELEGELGRVLETLQVALAKVQGDGGPRLLLGTFSFADIAMAQVLAFVSPPAFGLRMGKATRRTFTDPALLARFADLVTWRDALYERYRPRPPADAKTSV
jgi:glutathione S-transferase